MGDLWLVIGDFNAYLTAFDKSGGANLNLSSMQRFQECLLNCGLSDMGFKGPPFTWEGRGVKERLDRGVCNPQWLLQFPESSILHLPQLKSDGLGSRPFRFLASWLTHEDFHKVVESTWD